MPGTRVHRTIEGTSYVYGTEAAKIRLLRELKFAFSKNTQYNGLVDYIRPSFAFNDRPQYGIILKNISGTYVPLSPQNFQGITISHVFLAKTQNDRGEIVAWVKEHVREISKEVLEDLSSQVTGNSAVFNLSSTPVLNYRTGQLLFKPSPIYIQAKVNNVSVRVVHVNPRTGQISLDTIPVLGSTVEVRYYYRNLVKPGIYKIETVRYDKLEQDPKVTARLTSMIYVDEEEIVEEFDPLVFQFQISNPGIVEESDFVYRDDFLPLVRGYHYTVNYTTGQIDFDPARIPLGSRLFIEYKYNSDLDREFSYFPDTAREDIIDGVVIAFSNRVPQFEPDKEEMPFTDSVYIVVSDRREPVYLEYGGRIDLNVDFEVYSRDKESRNEIADLIPVALFGSRKVALDHDGVTIKAPTIGGWSEQIYDENTEDRYYTATVSFPLQTDWMLQVPLDIKLFRISFEASNGNKILADEDLNQEVLGVHVVENVITGQDQNTGYEVTK